MRKSKEEKIVDKMNSILEEVSELHGEDVTDGNYREYYENAADELNLHEEEDEDGENDIYRMTFELLDDYCSFRQQLREILIQKGLDLEQRKAYYKKHLNQ